jgi:hypothetical protein
MQVFPVFSSHEPALPMATRRGGVLAFVCLLANACAPENRDQRGDSGILGWQDTGMDQETSVPKDADNLLPVLMVDPEMIDLGVICDVKEREVTLFNDGPGLLLIEGILIDGDGWGVSGLWSSQQIESGSQQQLAITGGEGSGTLIIQSNDPNNHRVEVSLMARAVECAPLKVSE